MKLSLLTAGLLGTLVSAQAAEDIASAFKEGKLEGRIRAHYFSTERPPCIQARPPIKSFVQK